MLHQIEDFLTAEALYYVIVIPGLWLLMWRR